MGIPGITVEAAVSTPPVDIEVPLIGKGFFQAVQGFGTGDIFTDHVRLYDSEKDL